MSDLVERVAKAIYDAPDFTSGDFVAEALAGSPYVNSLDDVKRICEDAAKAALAVVTPELEAKDKLIAELVATLELCKTPSAGYSVSNYEDALVALRDFWQHIKLVDVVAREALSKAKAG